jgi:hypothetical protein
MSRRSFLSAIRSSRLQITALCLTIGYLIWTVNSGLAFQVPDHLVSQSKNAPKEPVNIVSVVAKNKQLKLNEAFKGSDDWLRGTQLRLKNNWDKDIIYIEVRLSFPQTRASGNEMAFPLELGNLPGSPVYRDPLQLSPGQEVILPLTEKEYEGLQRFIETRQKLPSIKHLQLEVAFIVFADETAWQSGIPMKRHPTNPRGWITAKVK